MKNQFGYQPTEAGSFQKISKEEALALKNSKGVIDSVGKGEWVFRSSDTDPAVAHARAAVLQEAIKAEDRYFSSLNAATKAESIPSTYTTHYTPDMMLSDYWFGQNSEPIKESDVWKSFAPADELCSLGDVDGQDDGPVTLDLESPFFAHLDDIISKAEQCFDNVMIAGGAIRDTLLGKKVKDIDIYIEANDYGEQDYLKFGKLVGRSSISVNEAFYGGDGNTMSEIVDYDADNSFPLLQSPIQLIIVKDLAEHFDTFTIGLSKVKYTADGLTMSKEFMHDVKYKQLTVNLATGQQSADQKAQKEEYITKVAKKYSDWEVVRPQIAQKTIKEQLALGVTKQCEPNSRLIDKVVFMSSDEDSMDAQQYVSAHKSILQQLREGRFD